MSDSGMDKEVEEGAEGWENINRLPYDGADVIPFVSRSGCGIFFQSHGNCRLRRIMRNILHVGDMYRSRRGRCPTDGGAAAEAEEIKFSAAAIREEKRVLIFSL